MSTLREQVETLASQNKSLSFDDCLKTYTLQYLKEYAQKIGMDVASVAFYGTKSKKINWFLAIDNFEKSFHTDNETITEDKITELKEIEKIRDVMIVDNSVTEDNPFSDNDDWLEGVFQPTVTSDNLTTKKCVNPNPDCDCVEPCFGCHKIYENDDDETYLRDCNQVVSNSFDSSTLNDDLNDDLTKVLDDTHTIIDGEYVMKSEICNPATLQSLRITDQNFFHYQNWMLPGAKFYTHNQEYQILYFDLHGNCHAKGLTDNRWHSFRIESIVNTMIYRWQDVSHNAVVKPSVSMLYKPTIISRKTRLKKEGSNGVFRVLNVLYDRSFIVWRLATVMSAFGRDDKYLLKGLFDDVLQQILINEHNNELLESYGMSVNDDEVTDE